MKTRPNLVDGPVAPTLLRLAAPMLVAMLAMVGFNVVDTFFIGRLGTGPLAAISFTFPVVFVVSSLALGLGVGVSAVVARAVGQGDHHRIQRLTTDAMLLSFLVVAVVAGAGYLALEPLFTALGAGPEVLPLIAHYMRPWFLGVPVLGLAMVGNSAVRATGDTRTPASIMLLAMVVNLVLDPVLIFGLGPIPALGMQGAAYATVGSRAITLVAALLILGRRERMLTFVPPAFAEVLASWRSILFIGLPAALTNLIVPASMALVTRLVAAHGLTAVAGFGVATRLEMLPMMVINALGSVLVPFMGQNWGAGRLDRVKAAARFSHGVALGVGLVAVGLFWVVGAPAARIFDATPEVVAVVVLYGRVAGFGWGLQGTVTLSSSAFNALHRPLPSTTLSLLRMAVLYVPLAWALSHWFGLVGIFVAALVANGVTGVAAIGWLRAVVVRMAREAAAGAAGGVPDEAPATAA